MATDKFCGSFGINTRLGFAPSADIDGGAFQTAATRLEILAENFIFGDNKVGGRGLTGLVDPYMAHLRDGQRMVRGGMVFEAGPHELGHFLTAILGNTAAAETKDKPDLVPHDFTVDRDLVTRGYRYCIPRSVVIRGRANVQDDEDQIMQVAMDFMGVEESVGVTWPGALTLDTSNRYFWLMGDAAFTDDSVDFPIINFQLTIDNTIQPLFRNQLLPGCFRSLGRRITLDVAIPLSQESFTSIGGPFDNTDAREVVLDFVSTNLPADASAYRTTFTFNKMFREQISEPTRGRGEVPLMVRYMAYTDGDQANPAMVITNTTS